MRQAAGDPVAHCDDFFVIARLGIVPPHKKAAQNKKNPEFGLRIRSTVLMCRDKVRYLMHYVLPKL